MRTNLTKSPADHIVLVGTGAAAMAALWRLCAAGAHVRWFADRADVGEETVLAHALGRGRIELTFDDPLSASLEGAAAVVIADQRDRHARLAERARASGVAVHSVGAAEQSAMAPDDPVHVARSSAAVGAA
jgi:siroheme synthase (precorrin-2 oxidase/ferrochelatase)